MSRIGKQPIAIPSGVEVSVEGNVLKFKKGAHLKELDTKGHVDVKVEDAHIVFSPKSDERQDRAYWGTYRALANNIVIVTFDSYDVFLYADFNAFWHFVIYRMRKS